MSWTTWMWTFVLGVMLLLLPMRASAAVYPCTEAGLNAGLAAGGLVQFSCTSAASIPLSNGKTIAVSGTVIDGQGLVTFQGGSNFGLWTVAPGVTGTLRNLTITGANIAALGAVLVCSGNCALEQVTVTGNNASSGGAQIYAVSATLAVTNSTVTGGSGNAIFGDTATISVTNSTIYGALRGVVARNGTTATVRNSSLLAMNTGVQATNPVDTVSLGHVLFGDNAADTSGTNVMSVGFNLIEDAFPGAQTTDIVGVPARYVMLASNGGLTQTAALQGCSAAINAGSTTAPLMFDQRGAGFPRVQQGRQDIGAFESNLTPVPCIPTQPLPQTVFAGQTLTLSVGAITGLGTLSYQWRRNGSNIPGATSSTYTKTAAVPDTGSYDVIVSNASGSVTSNAVAVVVNGPPTIMTPPAGQTLFAGQTLTLSVAATGVSVTYQWRRNGSNIPGATSATYTKTAAVPDTGSYDVILTNPAGSVTSTPVTVTVNGPPSITMQPGGQTLFVGQALTLTVVASGTGLTYQWRLNNNAIPGATSPTYAKPAVLADAGNYDVVITNPAGNATSNMVAVVVNGPPMITSNPMGQMLFAGQMLSLSVVASGMGVTYQWQRNGMSIPGATMATYTKVAVVGDAGNYTVVLTNPAGSVPSQTAVVTVEGPPVIVTDPVGQSLFAGQPLNLSVMATGQQLTYQWRKDMTALPGETTAMYSVGAVSTANIGNYDVVVTNPAGSVTSRVAMVVVQGPPSISAEPMDVSVFQGQPFSLSVQASGMSLGYQWRRGGMNLPGETQANLMRTAAAAGDAGDYDVIVTNPSGSVTSRMARVTVKGPPMLDQGPMSINLFVGQPLTLSVRGTGDTLSYQWRRDRMALPQATSATLMIARVTLQDAGVYDCVVTNPAASVTSTTATVTVYGPPEITQQPMAVQVTEGDPLNLTVTATGNSLSYQWQKGTNNIPNATSATYSVAMATPSDAGDYLVVVSNPAGSVNSMRVTVQVQARTTPSPGCGCRAGGRNAGFVPVGSLFAPLLVLHRRRRSRTPNV